MKIVSHARSTKEPPVHNQPTYWSRAHTQNTQKRVIIAPPAAHTSRRGNKAHVVIKFSVLFVCVEITSRKHQERQHTAVDHQRCRTKAGGLTTRVRCHRNAYAACFGYAWPQNRRAYCIYCFNYVYIYLKKFTLPLQHVLKSVMNRECVFGVAEVSHGDPGGPAGGGGASKKRKTRVVQHGCHQVLWRHKW